MTKELLEEIIKTKRKLIGKPVIANLDFCHTEPHCTLPIGGCIELNTKDNTCLIKVL